MMNKIEERQRQVKRLYIKRNVPNLCTNYYLLILLILVDKKVLNYEKFVKFFISRKVLIH